MGATINVNDLTVVHAGSSGIAMTFPDVCKTPTPAGPVPIPYPNTAQSSDTADGSTTVKMDGNPIMLKSSNYQMSSGDEAGSAMGVASNKIKGKALPTNASFDVKVDGSNVYRLTDPMQTNSGSPSNGAAPVTAQGALPEGTLQSEECKDLEEKRESQGEQKASENSGMFEPHFSAIKQVAQDFNVILYFRQTKSECKKWIGLKHQPKPHSVFLANTITGATVGEVDAWLRKSLNMNSTKLADADAESLALELALSDHALIAWKYPPVATNAGYFPEAAAYIGIVGEPQGEGLRRPVKSVHAQSDAGLDYSKKWITGDYDLFQVLRGTPGCTEVSQHDKFTFAKMKVAINEACSWDAIQHGPQVQWEPSEGAPCDFGAEIVKGIKTNNPSLTVPIEGRNPMKVFDDKVTVIAPGGVVYLETQQDTLDALKCRECDKK